MITCPPLCVVCHAFPEFLHRARGESHQWENARRLAEVHSFVAALDSGQDCPAHATTLALARMLTEALAEAARKETPLCIP
jgi:hypothetical protein